MEDASVVELLKRGVQPVWSAHYDIILKDGLGKGVADVSGKAVMQARVDGAI